MVHKEGQNVHRLNSDASGHRCSFIANTFDIGMQIDRFSFLSLTQSSLPGKHIKKNFNIIQFAHNALHSISKRVTR